MRWNLTITERFWIKVDKTGDCWEWRASRNYRGYGTFSIGYGKSPVLAHRRSYEMTYGAIPDGLFVLHHCDNPPCVRPEHLFLGTNADNMADMMKKGRYVPRKIPSGDASWSRNNLDRVARGERHAGVKLTNEQVTELRKLREEGKTFAYLSRTFGIGYTQIGRIIRRESWGHIP